MSNNIQQELAERLLTATDITVMGVLAVLCLVSFLVIRFLYKKVNELQDLRIKDKEKEQAIVVELAEKVTTAIHQVTEITKRH